MKDRDKSKMKVMENVSNKIVNINKIQLLRKGTNLLYNIWKPSLSLINPVLEKIT